MANNEIKATYALTLTKNYYTDSINKFKQTNTMEDIYTAINNAAKGGSIACEYTLGRVGTDISLGVFRYIKQTLMNDGYSFVDTSNDKYYVFEVHWDHHTIDWGK